MKTYFGPFRRSLILTGGLILAVIALFLLESDAAALGKKSGICGSWNNYCRGGGGRTIQPPPPPTPQQLSSRAYNRALEFEKQGKWREAESAYRRAIRLNPRNDSAWNNLGIILKNSGRYAEAEVAYRKSIRYNPRSLARKNLNNLMESRAFKRGSNLANQGRLREAERAYREVLRIDPNNSGAWNNLANILKRLGRHSDAERAYLKAIANDPNDRIARGNLKSLRKTIQAKEINRALDLAGNLRKQGRYGEAERIYRGILRKAPDRVSAVEGLVRSLTKQNRLRDARQVYRRWLANNPNDASAPAIRASLKYVENRLERPDYYRGNRLGKQGRPREAIGAYRAHLRKNPRDDSAWSELGDVLRKQKRWNKAQEAYRKALAINPQAKWARRALTELLRKRASKFDGKEETVRAYREIIRLNPKSKWAWNNLGNAFHKQGKMKEAEEAYRKSVIRDPKDTISRNNLVNILYEQGKMQEAAKISRKVIAIDPKNDKAWNNLGDVFRKQGKMKEAEKAYRKALAINPKNKYARKSLARAKSYNESYFRVLDPVLNLGMKPLRKAGNLAGRSAKAVYGYGKTLVSAAKNKSVSVWQSTRLRAFFGNARIREASRQFAQSPLVNLAAGKSKKVRDWMKNRKENSINWMESKSLEAAASQIPGVQFVRSTNEEYQKLKEGYKGLAIRNLSDVMSAMREGIGELGSSNGISGRSEWLVRNNGRRWQNWARGKSEDKIKSKAEGLFDGVKSNWVKRKFKYDSWFGEAR